MDDRHHRHRRRLGLALAIVACALLGGCNTIGAPFGVAFDSPADPNGCAYSAARVCGPQY